MIKSSRPRPKTSTAASKREPHIPSTGTATASNPRYSLERPSGGELAAYTSAIILIGIALHILVEGINRFVSLDWVEALGLSFVGLSGTILGCGGGGVGADAEASQTFDHRH